MRGSVVLVSVYSSIAQKLTRVPVFAMVTVSGMGNDVYTSWAQNAGYDIPLTVSDICSIVKSRWEPLTFKSLDYASGCMVGNFPWLTITGTAIGST